MKLSVLNQPKSNGNVVVLRHSKTCENIALLNCILSLSNDCFRICDARHPDPAGGGCPFGVGAVGLELGALSTSFHRVTSETRPFSDKRPQSSKSLEIIDVQGASRQIRGAHFQRIIAVQFHGREQRILGLPCSIHAGSGTQP